MGTGGRGSGSIGGEVGRYVGAAPKTRLRPLASQVLSQDRAMNKRRINLFPAMIASIVFLVATVCVSLHYPVIEFDFLDGLTPVLQSRGNGMASEMYRLERDYNEVCIEAVAELTDLGFVESPVFANERGSLRPAPKICQFRRHGHNDMAVVHIREVNGRVIVDVNRRYRRLSLGRWLRCVLSRNRRGRPRRWPHQPSQRRFHAQIPPVVA